MHPILFTLGPLTIYTYGVAMAAALLVGVGLAAHATRRDLRGRVPLSPQAVVDWGCWIMLGGVIGGRLLYVGLNWEVYVRHLHETLALWHGGLVWYGGFLGGLLAQTLYFRAHRYPFLAATDQIIPFLALGHAIGRLGCFANGCCVGTATTTWFGVQFPGHATAVVPTQLLEAAGLLALYGGLRALQTPRMLSRPGRLFGIYLIGYAVLRWTTEFWRAGQPIVWLGVTLHQVISLFVLVTGVVLFARTRGKITKHQIPSSK